MGYSITTTEDVTVLAVRYALGRATYIVSMTCSAVREMWPSLSTEAREAIARVVDETLRSAHTRGTTVGMQMDDDQWRSLADWMTAHVDDAPGTGEVTCDESMLLSAVRIAMWEGEPQPVIERVKACWSQLSSNYRGLIRRDVASDLRMFARIEENSLFDTPTDADAWDELLAWIDDQSDVIATAY